MSDEDRLPEPIAPDEDDPRIRAAISELKEMILCRYPEATFTIGRGADQDGISLTPIVDVEDLDEVAEIVTSRLVDMQVDEGLPVYVVPEWPLHRIREYLDRRAAPPVEERVASLVP